MGAPEEPEEPEERSPLAGACVLVLLAGVVFAVVFAASAEAGVLAVWAVGVGAVWWSARRRVSDSSATPPQGDEPPLGDVFARETTRVREVRKGPGEGITIFPEIEHVTEP